MENSNTTDAVAITLDRDHENGPDWTAIRQAAKEQDQHPDGPRIVDRVRELWENPERFTHVSKVMVRDGHTLVVGGGNTATAINDRETVGKFKELGIHEKAGFDGRWAGGTWDSQFAWWFTPREIWAEIEENDAYDPADFDQQAIEDAARRMTGNTDSAWQMFDEMREDVINNAAYRSRMMRKQTANAG